MKKKAKDLNDALNEFKSIEVPKEIVSKKDSAQLQW